MKVLQIAALCMAVFLLLSGCGSAADDQLGEILYMTGEKSGPHIANLHEITALTGEPTTERGVWGGSMSRLAVTSDGVYTAYMTGGGAGEDYPRPFTLFRLAAGGSSWEPLGSGESTTDAVVTLAGADGRVYAVTLSQSDNMNVPAIYMYDPKTGSFDQLMDVTNPSPGDYGYLTAAIDASDTVTILMCGGDAPGSFRHFSFNTKKQEFSEAHGVTLDYRHCYAYLHVNGDGSLEIQAERDVLYDVLGYPAIEGLDFGYVFDGVRYFKITDLSSYDASVDIRIREEDPAQYQETLTGYPTVINNYTGDACWDSAGRLHVLYTVSAKSNNWTAETWHAVIENGRLTEHEKLWDGASSLRMVQDGSGDFYLLKMAYGSTKLELYRSNADDGLSFSQAGSFDLSAAGSLQYAGLYVAKPEGGTPGDSTVDVIYPSRGDGEEFTEHWNYFRLYLK